MAPVDPERKPLMHPPADFVVLVVDDHDLARQTICSAIATLGYAAIAAVAAKPALEALRCRAVNLVCTDIVMPDMDGLEFIARVRAEFEGLPILAISGGTREHGRDLFAEARLRGADKVLAKPFSLASLKEAIEDFIGAPRQGSAATS